MDSLVQFPYDDPLASMVGSTESKNPVYALADTFRELKEKKDALEATLKEVNKEIERLEEQFTAEMINEETPKFSRRGKTFYLTEKLYVNSLAAKSADLHKYLREKSLGDMIKETVHPSTLKSYVKELLEEDDELPEGLKECISYLKRPAIGMRKI